MDISLFHMIPPILILVGLFSVIGRLYFCTFGKILPRKMYNSSRGFIAFAILYVWAIPMEIGYYEFFRAMF